MPGEGLPCRICGVTIVDSGDRSLLADAGDWLSEDLWNDRGDLCCQCLENRGLLALMYLRDRNG